jgi:hypothetical protein
VQLIVYFVVFMVAGDFVDYLLGLAVEQIWPRASLVVFLGLYFLSLWVAWLLAIRMTEPKGAGQAATRAS